MDFEKNKVSQDDLENVSGGTIIETKDGKFVILPSGVKFYDKKEDAEKAEKDYFKKIFNQPLLSYGCPRKFQELPIEIKKVKPKQTIQINKLIKIKNSKGEMIHEIQSNKIRQR